MSFRARQGAGDQLSQELAVVAEEESRPSLRSLHEEGESAGLETFAFTRQAPWLAACGLLEGLEDASESERIEALQLMQLDGMDEEIRVLAQSRDVDFGRLQAALPGLSQLRSA